MTKKEYLKELNKAFGDFKFFDEDHHYEYKGQRVGMSATKLIEEYVQKFNSQAIAERVAIKEDKTVQEILDEWKYKNDFSVHKGSTCHEYAQAKWVLRWYEPDYFDKSFEYGQWDGLGLIRGEIRPISDFVPEGLKIPHMGWNALCFTADSKLFRYIKEGDCVYFVHSFYVDPGAESVVATAEYGREVTAAVQKGNVMGCQFHPEKSGEVGLNILRAFCDKEENA